MSPSRLALALATTAALPAAQEPERPDIVVVLVDDMGFSDIGCYGGEISTPTVDRLAAGGVRFTQFYNTARCCPTRASLLTGLYPHQAGVGHMMNDRGYDGYRGDLNNQCVTIAEVLRGAGYSTYMAGKWHVTKSTAPNGPKHNWPLQRGFDRFFGTITGAGSFYTPNTLTDGNTHVTKYPEGFFYTDAINDHAVRYIREHDAANDTAPFFLYVAHTAPHWPLHAKPADIAKYRGRYRIGWDALRARRHARMIELGIVDAAWPLTPRDTPAKAWDDVDSERRDNMDLRMAIYAAQIDCVDQGLARVVAALEETGRLDNTLFLFLADNGGCAEGGIWGFDNKKNGELGEDSSFSSYGLSWANASNTPFRRYKHWVHEGGISTPLVAHWPNGIAARGGLTSQPGHLIDIMATCIDVAGAEYPQQVRGRDVHPPEGRSLRPAFAGRKIERDAIYWEHEGNRAVRVGDWKLVAKGANGPWELYDLATDRTELNDRAASKPDLVAELAAKWRSWAERSNVLPLNPRKEPRFSKRKKFSLKQGDDLERTKAPNVKNKGIRCNVVVDYDDADGVLVAQGGTTDGWALFVRDGRLSFATRRRNALHAVRADTPMPADPALVTAVLARDGQVTLSIDGQVVATGKVPGALVAMPLDGLQVGRDDGGNVGDYESPFAFRGTIGATEVEIWARKKK